MAMNSQTSFLLLSLFLAAAAFTPAQAFIVNGTLAQLTVAGRLFCTVDANPLAGLLSPPLVGANVLISCNGSQITLGQAVSNAAGLVQVIYSTVTGFVFDTSSCNATVTVANVVNCSVLPPTRVLQATLNLVQFVQGPVTGLLTAVLSFTPFVIISTQ